ncbi:MAG: hypothetical protein WCI20_09220 [bacterium]
MTPEEKLLALIQQDKRHTEGAAPSPVVPKPPDPVTPPPAPSPPPKIESRGEGTTPSPVIVNTAVSPEKEEHKLKLATPTAVKPVKPVKVESAVPMPVAPVPVPVLAPVVEPVKPAAPELVSGIPFVSLSTSRGIPLVFLNRVLGGCVILLIALVALRIGAIRPGIAEALEKQVRGAGNRPLQPLVMSEETVPALDAYLDKVSVRNIFIPKVAAKEGGATPEAVGSPKDLKLVAISIDSSVVSESIAIIKNKGDSKTYFVKSGQTIGSTEYVLDKVFSDHVIIKLRKQEFELK